MARQIGLKDIHVAVITKDDETGVTYDIPSKLERAISARRGGMIGMGELTAVPLVVNLSRCYIATSSQLEVKYETSGYWSSL